jgi:1-acyl-sn-glycerol-3-phosphate acyltransferase
MDYKRPNKIAWYIASKVIFIYSTYILKQKITYKNLPKIKGPFLLLGNHMCNFDFIYTMSSISPRYLHFVVARKYFHSKGIKKWLKLGGAIPKSLATSDITTIIAMLGAVKRGEGVGLYPSGRIGQWGTSYNVHEGTAALVKKLDIPVIIVRGYGGFFANPPYMKTKKRKGPTHTEIFLGFTQSEIRSLSTDEILKRLNEYLYVDQYEWLEKSNAKYMGKDFAKGIENFAYRCPSCGSVHSLITNENNIKCNNCGLQGTCDATARFKWSKDINVNDLRKWHDIIINYELNEILNNPNWNLSSEVTVASYGSKEDSNGIHIVGNGTVNLNKEFFSYTGTYEGDNISFKLKNDNIRYFPYESGYNFQLYRRNKLFEFRPKNPKDCGRFSICLDAVKRISGSEYE